MFFFSCESGRSLKRLFILLTVLDGINLNELLSNYCIMYFVNERSQTNLLYKTYYCKTCFKQKLSLRGAVTLSWTHSLRISLPLTTLGRVARGGETGLNLMTFGVFVLFRTLYLRNKFIIEFPNKTVNWLENSYGKTFNIIYKY